jgi:hypothetical protein
MMTIKMIKLNTKPDIIVRLKSLWFSGIPAPFKVKTATNIISKQQRDADRTGETNQLITILLSYFQLILYEPKAAKPAPINLPNTVCVPEIGIPKKEEQKIKRKDPMLTASII